MSECSEDPPRIQNSLQLELAVRYRKLDFGDGSLVALKTVAKRWGLPFGVVRRLHILGAQKSPEAVAQMIEDGKVALE